MGTCTCYSSTVLVTYRPCYKKHSCNINLKHKYFQRHKLDHGSRYVSFSHSLFDMIEPNKCKGSIAHCWQQSKFRCHAFQSKDYYRILLCWSTGKEQTIELIMWFVAACAKGWLFQLHKQVAHATYRNTTLTFWETDIYFGKHCTKSRLYWDLDSVLKTIRSDNVFEFVAS